MSLLGNLTVGILGNMNGLSDTFTDAQRQLRDFGRNMENIGGNLSKAGESITKIAGPAFAALGGAIGFTAKKAMDFESQMSSVKSVMSPDEVMKFSRALEELALKMGAETKYSSLEAAQGIEELIKAGVSLDDIINGGLKGTLSLAVAGELELADAAEIASTALNAFKNDNISVSRAADLLAGAANASATSVSEMKFSLAMVSAVASGVGLSFEDTTTALATFAQNGLKGSDAGTSLKTMLLRLSPTTKEAAAAFEQLGLSTYNTSAGYKYLVDKGITPASRSVEDIQKGLEKLTKEELGSAASKKDLKERYKENLNASGLMSSAFYDESGSLKSMAQIAEILKTSMAGLNDEQRQNYLNTMFGTDAIRAANILFKEGANGITSMADAMNKISADDVAATKLDNVKGRIEILKGTIETAAIAIGKSFLPIIDKVVGAIQKMVNWFNNLSPEMADLIAKVLLVSAAITGLATAFGIVLIVVGGVISSVGTIATAFASLSASIAAAGGIMAIITGPIGLTIAAIVALGAALIALWNNSETFRNSVTTIFNNIKNVAVQAFGIIASFIGEKIAQIKQFWDENGTLFLQAVENVFNGIMAVVNFVMPAIKFIIEMVWTAIKQVIGGALEIIMGLMKVFAGLFTGDFGKMWEGIKQIFFGAIDFIIGMMTLSFVGGLKNLLFDLVKSGLGLVKGMADGIVNFFSNFSTIGQNLAKGFVDGVVNFFRNLVDSVITLFDLFRARGASSWEAFKGVLLSILNSLKAGITAIWDFIVSFLTNGASMIWNGVTAAFRGMLNGISSIFGSVRGTIENIWGGVMGFFRGIDLFQIGKNIIQGLINGLGSMTSAVWEKAKSIANGIGNSIKNALGIHSPSRLAIQLMEFFGDGMVIGMDNSVSDIMGAASNLANAAIPDFPQINTGLNIGGRGNDKGPLVDASPFSITINPAPVIMDGQQIAEVQFNHIDNMQAAKFNQNLRLNGVRR
ncbi:phage tail tape measure protein [Neobacillus massiliamazoniensis]|uniref:TP901 family phage tail tape measure protein n=1 Tax=Neobacillus massiliamazoniensis TaxID=1499688 RepID=A0A0U1NRD5_9BACI|nr:phage tail tape measure protein [Neobacillus massiliamazoniensis]CRK80302.1 TP901 family phage tail tape measure protein [Neobacillus massiliamazoniensis]